MDANFTTSKYHDNKDYKDSWKYTLTLLSKKHKIRSFSIVLSDSTMNITPPLDGLTLDYVFKVVDDVCRVIDEE
jgi:hypothetical protein